MSYLSIARRWLAGQGPEAVTGYWGPLLSWATAPLLALGASPLLALRAVLGLAGVATVVVALVVLDRDVVHARATTWPPSTTGTVRSAVLPRRLPQSRTDGEEPEAVLVARLRARGVDRLVVWTEPDDPSAYADRRAAVTAYDVAPDGLSPRGSAGTPVR